METSQVTQTHNAWFYRTFREIREVKSVIRTARRAPAPVRHGPREAGALWGLRRTHALTFEGACSSELVNLVWATV